MSAREAVARAMADLDGFFAPTPRKRDFQRADIAIAAYEAERGLQMGGTNVVVPRDHVITLPPEDAGLYLDPIEQARRDIVDAALNLVGLWNSQRIKGLTRAQRNAAIDDVRGRLIEAARAMLAAQEDKP